MQRPLRSSSPTANPPLPCPLNHLPLRGYHCVSFKQNEKDYCILTPLLQHLFRVWKQLLFFQVRQKSVREKWSPFCIVTKGSFSFTYNLLHSQCRGGNSITGRRAQRERPLSIDTNISLKNVQNNWAHQDTFHSFCVLGGRQGIWAEEEGPYMQPAFSCFHLAFYKEKTVALPILHWCTEPKEFSKTHNVVASQSVFIGTLFFLIKFSWKQPSFQQFLFLQW